MTKAKFSLGDELKDRVTGFRGIVLGITYYSTGCVHYGLQPKMKKDADSPPNWQWFDQSRLDILKKHAVEFDTDKKNPSGIFPNAPSG